MISKSVTIQIPKGLDARPIAELVQVANQYDSSVYLHSQNRKVNAKSIMGMMTLMVQTGDEILITADGTDENQAMENIEKYLSNQ